MVRAALIAVVFATPAAADVVGPGGKMRDCYCTDTQGGRVDLGQRICLFVDGRAFLALCDMSLNVPIWRDTGEGCVSSSFHPRQLPVERGDPARQSRPVDTHVAPPEAQPG